MMIRKVILLLTVILVTFAAVAETIHISPQYWCKKMLILELIITGKRHTVL